MKMCLSFGCCINFLFFSNFSSSKIDMLLDVDLEKVLTSLYTDEQQQSAEHLKEAICIVEQ